MDKSFHYYCIRVLAEKAGFSAHDAQTIAYASQYTDDASEFGRMNIAGMPDDFDFPRSDKRKKTFDPICTAHSAKSKLAMLWKWAKFYLKADVQRKILMPFHFLPPQALSDVNQDRFDFVTRENSPLAVALVEQALTCLSGSAPETKEYALIKLGIALHTYADTWAHAGFSGRHNSSENDIKNIGVRQGKRFTHVNPLGTVVSYAAPDVGHSEACTLPDTTNTEWKAGYANKKGGINRNNPQEFLVAAKEIYTRLSVAAGKNGADWPGLSPQIQKCLQTDGSWENIFGGKNTFSYSRFTWRAMALTGDSIHWDNFDDESDFHKLNFKFTGTDSKWLLFHKAAHEQRRFILQRIPERWVNA